MEKNTTDVQPIEAVVVEKKPGALKRFITNHPRAAKALALTGVGLGLVGVGMVVSNKKGSSSSDDSDYDDSDATFHLSDEITHDSSI